MSYLGGAQVAIKFIPRGKSSINKYVQRELLNHSRPCIRPVNRAMASAVSQMADRVYGVHHLQAGCCTHMWCNSRRCSSHQSIWPLVSCYALFKPKITTPHHNALVLGKCACQRVILQARPDFATLPKICMTQHYNVQLLLWMALSLVTCCCNSKPAHCIQLHSVLVCFPKCSCQSGL